MLFNEMRLVPSDILDVTHCWTLVSSMFLHAGVAHLLANMYSLFVLGSMCEPVFGRWKYLVTYFAGGIAGGVLFSVMRMASGSMATAVGASGAIFALMGMYAAMLLVAMRRDKANGDGGMSPRLRSAAQRYLVLLAINLFVIPMTGNIAWEAHVGGLVAGVVLGLAFFPRDRRASRPETA
jgi:membrane associated rhomboid family serine protease